MKKITYIPTLLIAVIISSSLITGCGNNETSSIEAIISGGDLEQVRAKKKELTEQQTALSKDIALLDSVISSNKAGSKLPLVTAFKVNNAEFKHFVELQGSVTTKQNVLIYPEMAGTLLRVNVEKGDKVSKGQLLATIDDGGMGNQLTQMKTQLELAKTTFERQKKLWEQNIGSEIQYLQAKTNYEAQKSAVKQLEGQLAKFAIRAPFSGIIDDVFKDQGNIVAPGGPGSEVFRIVNLSNMYVEVDVPESYLGSIQKGSYVEVFIPVLGETVKSYVRETGNFIKPDNRSYTAEIPVPNKNGKVKPNLTVRVKINDYTQPEAILIPQSVISENAEGDQYVYLAKGINKENVAQAVKNIITTGKTQGDNVEILTGLNAGQSVVKEGARTVKDGQDVKVLNQ